MCHHTSASALDQGTIAARIYDLSIYIKTSTHHCLVSASHAGLKMCGFMAFGTYMFIAQTF